MFRTLYVAAGERLSVSNNWLVIETKGESKKVPVDDIQTVVLDNIHACLSVYTLQSLAKNDVNVVICDEKHLPCCSVLSLNQHYRPYGVLKKQMALTQEFKDLLWQKIVKTKIENQNTALKMRCVKQEVIDRMQQLTMEVLPGDIGNREGIAAKIFFRNFYGYNFLRFEEDVINAALNFGYAIIRSAVARSLCAYGYNCALGIHHINESNAFNLADDFMEPLRPLVDLWVFLHNDELVDTLTKSNRVGLASIINDEVIIADKKMKLYNAIDKYIASFTTAIDSADRNKLLLPYFE